MPKPKIGRLQDEKLTGSRAYPPKPQGARQEGNMISKRLQPGRKEISQRQSLQRASRDNMMEQLKTQKGSNLRQRLDTALKSSQAQALRKTVINPPAMNSVAPPKVEGVRPERPTRSTSTRNELEKAFRKQQKKKY